MYTYGWNLSGYLPEMEPFVVDSWQTAVEGLIEALADTALEYAESGFFDSADACENLANRLFVEYLPIEDPEEIGINGVSGLAAGLTYWVEIAQ